MVHRAAAAAGGATALGVATLLGWVDIGHAVDLLSGRAVNPTSAFALVALLCWLAVATLGAITVGRLVAPGRLGGRRRQPWMLVLLAGALVLGIGIARHQAAYRVCCAGASAVQQAESLAR